MIVEQVHSPRIMLAYPSVMSLPTRTFPCKSIHLSPMPSTRVCTSLGVYLRKLPNLASQRSAPNHQPVLLHLVYGLDLPSENSRIVFPPSKTARLSSSAHHPSLSVLPHQAAATRRRRIHQLMAPVPPQMPQRNPALQLPPPLRFLLLPLATRVCLRLLLHHLHPL